MSKRVSIDCITPRWCDESYVLEKLREAGVPVAGFLIWTGFSEPGVLTRLPDEAGTMEFLWEPTP